LFSTRADTSDPHHNRGEVIVIKMLVVAAVIGACGGAVAIGAAPVALAQGQYSNCTQAHKDGRWDIPQGDPDYWSGGDRDGDGIACES
jgi:hypothetical protein